jgi:hypothetical protein
LLNKVGEVMTARAESFQSTSPAAAGEPPDPRSGLPAQQEKLRRLLQSAQGELSGYLAVLPDIDNTLLATARKRCQAAPDDRILGVLDFGGGEGEAALLFGSAGLCWRNGEDTPHAGAGSLTYAELAGRRLVNHGDVVYLGKDQFLCPQPDESGVDCEELVGLLYKVREAMAPRPA